MLRGSGTPTRTTGPHENEPDCIGTNLQEYSLAYLQPLAAAAGLSLLATAQAYAAGELNLYSSRHYDTDERLYSDFEEKTGITINRIEDKADALIERMKAEGTNSPADILLTVDAGRLWRADQAGLFQPVTSDVLESRIPDWLSHPDGHWYGFSQRVRILFYDKNKVNPMDIQTYADLADPKLKGLVCTREFRQHLHVVTDGIDHRP